MRLNISRNKMPQFICGFCLNQTFKHMNIEQIKNELILLIAQLTEAEFPDVENIREAVEIIFNQNSNQ